MGAEWIEKLCSFALPLFVMQLALAALLMVFHKVCNINRIKKYLIFFIFKTIYVPTSFSRFQKDFQKNYNLFVKYIKLLK